ncbi:MAG: hypothetical protein ACXW1T_11570 [Methylophilus sp.]
MTMLLLNQDFSDDLLSSLMTADLRNISKSAWQRVLSHCNATELRLYHLTLENLDGIEKLSNTEKLVLEWATKIERLEPIFHLNNLTSLSVSDFPKIRNITGIDKLTKLSELQLSGNLGSMNPPLRLTSIKPVSEIPNLTSFSLLNAKLDDDDVTAIAECKMLRHLNLSNQFERKQLAYLAKHLNGQLEHPLPSYRESSLTCPKCNEKKFMFTGRKMPFLCQKCDSHRFNKLHNEFEELVNAA